MGMMTKSLKNIATLLQLPDDIAEFTTIETAILRNIDDLHWSEKEKCYCDATIDDYEENSLVCHKGYISLFPFFLGLIDPKSDKLGHVLQLLGDEEELWSEFGIRSLSKKDEFYGTGENYWRGPVWMNMNYLAVSQLLVCPNPLQACHLLLTRNRNTHKLPALIKPRPLNSTEGCASISLRTSMTNGWKQALRGSSITLKLGRGSERNISLDGPV
jgi:hypothetical protein